MNFITKDTLDWRYGQELPTVLLGYREQVDPTPCYPHDLDLVKEYAQIAYDAFPLPAKIGPTYYILHFETPHRTNAWAGERWHYEGEGEDKWWSGEIAMSGKRTPIHPAVTRGVTVHEYGHIIERYLKFAWGDEKDYNTVKKEYIKFRHIEDDSDISYGPGNWHKMTGEIFADDFRLLLGKVETEFWPHPQISRPEEVNGLLGWWLEQKEKYAYRIPEQSD